MLPLRNYSDELQSGFHRLPEASTYTLFLFKSVNVRIWYFYFSCSLEIHTVTNFTTITLQTHTITFDFKVGAAIFTVPTLQFLETDRARLLEVDFIFLKGSVCASLPELNYSEKHAKASSTSPLYSAYQQKS